jgi:hypothetical protein
MSHLSLRAHEFWRFFGHRLRISYWPGNERRSRRDTNPFRTHRTIDEQHWGGRERVKTMETGGSAARQQDDPEMTEERRLELLRRVLQFDVEDAIARYEAEAGCSVVDLKLRLNGGDEYGMELAVDASRRQKTASRPAPRMLIFRFGR